MHQHVQKPPQKKCDNTPENEAQEKQAVNPMLPIADLLAVDDVSDVICEVMLDGPL